ncbi:DUF6895 family protein [Nocardia sp. NPDC050175]|uniref:DUF6895 family protein n=1 Tax=Nocardia sp. NPDC050175 TaxID=3364317 RepID=UPI0037BAEC46
MHGLHPGEELRGQIGGFPKWPQGPRIDADLDAPVLGAAIEWLTANLRWFDREQWDRFLPARQFPEGTVLELLVLCRILRRGRFRDHPLISGAIELALTLVASEPFRADIGRGDEKFPYRTYLVALLADLGYPVPSAADRVHTVLATGCGAWMGGWHTPLARLELQYALELGGFVSALPPVNALVGQTIVGAAPDPLYVRDDEVYALTHVVFYATDFAARPMSDEPGLVDTVRTLLGMYLALGNMDLAGELLLCTLTIRSDDCAITTHGWRALARHRRADGSVPGPLYDPARWSTLHGELAEAYAFGTCHHTTMVAAMAAAEREHHHAR